MFQVTPSHDTPNWVVVVCGIAAPIAGILGALIGKLHQKTATAKTADEAKRLSESNTRKIASIMEVLAEHTALHRGYVAMQTDMRTTRDCVNRIAGRLGVDGTS